MVLILWAVLITSTPATNKIVSADEKRYILDSLAGEVTDKKASVGLIVSTCGQTDMPVRLVLCALVLSRLCCSEMVERLIYDGTRALVRE